MASSVIAVGDELLAGFQQDTNSHWLAERLRLLGFPLKRITIVSDRTEDVVEQLRRDLSDAEVEDVYCCGGLGPTPDDRTFEAVAGALGRELVTWQPVLERIQRRVHRMHAAGLIESAEVSEGSVRMARIPAAPDHVFRNRRGMAPGLLYLVEGRRLFVLPGVPSELKGIFTQEIEPEFLTGRSAAVVRELRFLFAVEAGFYGAKSWSRSERWRLETWEQPLTLGRPLPTLPLWLTEDFSVPLDLEESYEETCRVLRIP